MMTLQEILNKADPQYYPDVMDAGSLSALLAKCLNKFGQELTASSIPDIQIPYARAEKGMRFSQVHIVAGKRLFMSDFWYQGVCYGNSSSSDIFNVAHAIYIWIIEEPSINRMLEIFPFFSPNEAGKAHETGLLVEYKWHQLLATSRETEELMFGKDHTPRPLIEVAKNRLELCQLYPYTSLSRLCFSRTTGYPFTDDCPSADAVGNGKFRAYYPQTGELIGEGTPEEVIDMVIQHLPPNYGAAVNGIGDDVLGLK